MADDKYLRLLAEQYPNALSVQAEMIRTRGLADLPKGTEYYFSDLHGEDVAFVHILRSASGTIRFKIHELFDGVLDEASQTRLANLVYAPDKVLQIVRQDGRYDEAWQRTTIGRLVDLARHVSSKYRRGSVESKMPAVFASILRELLFADMSDEFRRAYNLRIIGHIVEGGMADAFITGLCEMIRRVCVNRVHVIGDIFDRGSGPHKVMEALIDFGGVDVQWGNHDIQWMAAAAGSQVAMCSVLRVGIGYNTFDALEHGYGLNLRALSTFAQRTYGDDPCERFQTKIIEETVHGRVDPELSARMHKAIAIIMLKLEAQLLRRHPEYGMAHRDVLAKTDFRRMVYREGDREYPLLDTNFPTIDPDDPARLTPEEEELLAVIDASFRGSETLHRHMDFLYEHGSAYLCANGNLLFHGCVPLTAEGEFDGITVDGRFLAGRALFDHAQRQMIEAYRGTPGTKAHADAVDFAWYLWCGPLSPMFGKSKMSTFENYFVADRAVRKEHYNPYYTLCEQPEICEKILAEFGLPPETGHIVNGHVPVKIKDGESPVKGGGKLYVIDGGISKAYHSRTGIAGYTLIYTSHHLMLAEHRAYAEIENDLGSYAPKVTITEVMPERVMTERTDWGAELRSKLADLTDLLEAYREGRIKESRLA
nr:fructose-1,6-bisphosphatase [Propionibacterium sp.]